MEVVKSSVNKFFVDNFRNNLGETLKEILEIRIFETSYLKNITEKYILNSEVLTKIIFCIQLQVPQILIFTSLYVYASL